MQWCCSIGTCVSHIDINASSRDQQLNHLVVSKARGNMQRSITIVSCTVDIHRVTANYLHTAVLLWSEFNKTCITTLHTFNSPLSGTTWLSRYQKGKTYLDFTEARDSEWQWHQLGHMQVCTSLQTDNHASTPTLSFFTGRMPFLPPNQQCQSTEGSKNCITENKYQLSQMDQRDGLPHLHRAVHRGKCSKL